jgi:hypothetical protein
MSSYWDAVTRTALGLAGTAVPRPRSIFESDNHRLAGDDAARPDDGGDASGGPAGMPAAPARDARPVMAAPPNVDVLTAPVAPAIQNDERPEAEPSDASPRRASDAGSIEVSPAMPDANAHVVRIERVVERVEVQRLETIHTIAEPAQHESPGEEPAAPRAPVLALPVTVGADDRRETAGATADEDAASPAPIVVVAEPNRAITEPPAPAAAREVQPLVIEIDHIDIRIESETPVATAVPRRRERETVPSLDDYLQARSKGRR